MIVRTEQPRDRAEIFEVHARAASEQEARIVDRLRTEEGDRYGPSLVAEDEGRVIGHALLTRARIDGDPPRPIFVLGPVSVLPEGQGRGVGSALIERGLELVDLPVIVLGHAAYYPRFGFRPALPLGIRWPWEDDEDLNDVWFVWFPAGADASAYAGVVRYPAAFDEV